MGRPEGGASTRTERSEGGHAACNPLPPADVGAAFCRGDAANEKRGERALLLRLAPASLGAVMP